MNSLKGPKRAQSFYGGPTLLAIRGSIPRKKIEANEGQEGREVGFRIASPEAVKVSGECSINQTRDANKSSFFR